jgi:hypothetical protein
MILKNRKRTFEFVLKRDDPFSDQDEKRKRTTGPKQNKIDEVVYQWYNNVRSASL